MSLNMCPVCQENLRIDSQLFHENERLKEAITVAKEALQYAKGSDEGAIYDRAEAALAKIAALEAAEKEKK